MELTDFTHMNRFNYFNESIQYESIHIISGI